MDLDSQILPKDTPAAVVVPSEDIVMPLFPCTQRCGPTDVSVHVKLESVDSQMFPPVVPDCETVAASLMPSDLCGNKHQSQAGRRAKVVTTLRLTTK